MKPKAEPTTTTPDPSNSSTSETDWIAVIKQEALEAFAASQDQPEMTTEELREQTRQVQEDSRRSSGW